jgi:uncharacterized membrane protein YraQ (UPF0718 family)
MQTFWQNTWALILDSSVYLLAGFFLAGLMKAFISRELIIKHLGKRNFRSVFLASLVGVPLPVCSCGILPLVQDFRRRGASKGATVSFLASTPQTGMDSIAITYGLMGLGMALLRPIYAFFAGIFCGVAENFADKAESCNCAEKHANDTCCHADEAAEKKGSCCNAEEVAEETCSCCHAEKPVEKSVSCCDAEYNAEEISSCCHSDKIAAEKSSCCHDGKTVEETVSCCSHEATTAKEPTSCCQTAQKPAGVFSRMISGVYYAFNDLLRDISLSLLLGFLLGGLIATFLSDKLVADYFGGGLAGMIGMVFVSIPMYICSTSSTPVGVAFLLKGMSPGTVLIFLMAGPVTNAASLVVLTRVLGKRTVVQYTVLVILLTLALGLLTDFLFSLEIFKSGIFMLNLESSSVACPDHHAGMLNTVAAFILLGLCFFHSGGILQKKLYKKFSVKKQEK